MTPLSTRQSWICLKVASGRGSARSTPLITAPTCGVSFSTLIVDDAMADLLWLAAIPWRTPALSSSSRCRVAAVHRQRHAGHELRLVAGEIEDGRGHVCRLAEAAEWMALLERLMPSRVTGKGCGHRRLDHAGADAVHAHAGRPRERHGPRQVHHAALRGRVGG